MSLRDATFVIDNPCPYCGTHNDRVRLAADSADSYGDGGPDAVTICFTCTNITAVEGADEALATGSPDGLVFRRLSDAERAIVLKRTEIRDLLYLIGFSKGMG
jgi:hypothetical protein